MGLFLVNGQAGASNGFAVLLIQIGRNGLDSFAVQSRTGKVGQTDLVTSNFQVTGGALCKCFLDLGFE